MTINDLRWIAVEARVQIPSLAPLIEIKAPVAQLDRVADFESVGRTFESYQARQIKILFELKGL